MAVIDRDLVRAVNSGRCFVLFGSGPSCELGVPSWRQLAESVIEKIDQTQSADAVEKCRALLAKSDYPKLFSLVEQAMGQQNLLQTVKASLEGCTGTGRVYQYIAAWPFSCYLTTNFDDYLRRHLEAIGLSFPARRNSKEDMQLLRADTKNVIFKIHGDPTVPKDIVLTEEQYLAFREGEDREYWREKISSVLHMVSLVLIGYSASDPDFRDQLERAKKIASPNHPIFMFTSGVPDNDIKDYYQKFNIRIIPYSTKNGKYPELHRLLKRYDPFIAKRENPSLGLDTIDESIASLAASMYLFTQLRLADTNDACIEKIYASAILQILSQTGKGETIGIERIRESLAAKTFAASNVDPTAMKRALECLYSLSFISLTQEGTAVQLQPRGHEAQLTIKVERKLLREKFEGSCRVFLKREYPNLEAESVESVVDALQRGLVTAYERRGLEIARSAFSEQAVDLSDATDLLDTINTGSSSLGERLERMAFADLMIEVILRPDEQMKEYLVALSQGYFAYHALGLEPRCSRERLVMAIQKKWILDSSILLPILAIDCMNHDYATDLLKRMKQLKLSCGTTERLFEEVRDHAWWAIANFADAPPDAPDLLQAAMAGPGYKENLFLNGFTKWSLGKGNPSLDEYMAECLGSNYRKTLPQNIRTKIRDWGIDILDFSEWPNFSQDAWPERDEIAKSIEQLRRKYGTFTGPNQCIAEAEVFLITRLQNAAFLSQSGILNKVPKKSEKIAWNPEAMYRFLALFSTTPIKKDLLFDCMIQDFYYVGFDIVDKNTISQYAAPMVRQSRMELDRQKVSYEKALGRKEFARFQEDFERVPDEQKPFYSMQFAFYVAAQEARKRELAEARAQQAEKTKRLTDKERGELERLKAEKTERHKKAERKRRKSKSKPKGKGKKKKKRK
jgi:hypothetical protein